MFSSYVEGVSYFIRCKWNRASRKKLNNVVLYNFCLIWLRRVPMFALANIGTLSFVVKKGACR